MPWYLRAVNLLKARLFEDNLVIFLSITKSMWTSVKAIKITVSYAYKLYKICNITIINGVWCGLESVCPLSVCNIKHNIFPTHDLNFMCEVKRRNYSNKTFTNKYRTIISIKSTV